MRVVPEKHTRSLQPDAAATVRMVHEDEFAAVGMRFFEGRKLSRLGTEGLGCVGSRFFGGGVGLDD